MITATVSRPSGRRTRGHALADGPDLRASADEREGRLARLNWAGTRTGCDGDPNTHRAHGAHLVATVTAQAITGTVTLKDGRSAPFTARLLPDPGRTYGLFRSEPSTACATWADGSLIHQVLPVPGWEQEPRQESP